MKRALLVGESWTTHMIHQKGFDSFTTTEYVEGGAEFRRALEVDGWIVQHIPAHLIERDFPSDVKTLTTFDLVILSDVGANSFLLTRQVFGQSKCEPNRLQIIRDWVLGGGALLMVGGYLSFSGIEAKARYARSPIGELLPVQVLDVEDLEEHPEGLDVVVVDVEHLALGGLSEPWPKLLGYNRTKRRDEGVVLVEVNGEPLIAVREVGSGRSAVFTSDMSPHWAPPEFMEWSGYGILWPAIANWLIAA